jgi:peptidylprolyl isomerase
MAMAGIGWPLAAQTPLPASPPASSPATPADIIAKAPPSAWADIPSDQILVMTLDGGGHVLMQLAPIVSPEHVERMQALARAHWWDGTAIYRVQDDYVAQWGDRSERKPLPPGLTATLPEAYSIPRAQAGPGLVALPFPDSYARETGFLRGWPVAMDGDRLWLTHCYGMVGAARDLAPNAGNGAELYAVIGHAPRQLDRNIALVGRVVAGIDQLSSLPRGTEKLGMYGDKQMPKPILSVRLASDLPPGERPMLQMMDTGSPSFTAYVRARANRDDSFFRVPAGGVDVCNIPVPTREKTR